MSVQMYISQVGHEKSALAEINVFSVKDQLFEIVYGLVIEHSKSNFILLKLVS